MNHFIELINKMRGGSILRRAIFHLGYVFVFWIATGFASVRIPDPLMSFLYTSISCFMISGTGLLLFLDPMEKDRLADRMIMHHEIMKILSETFGCTVQEIYGESKQAHIACARQVFCYILRRKMGEGLETIASIINRTTHSAVSHAVKRVEDLIFTKDSRVIRALKEIDEKLFKQ